MSKFPCGWCGTHIARSIPALAEHVKGCRALKARMNALPSDLVIKVYRGGMKLEAAEREAAARPSIRL